MYYDSIGKTLVQRTELSKLSGRCKVNLLFDLLQQMNFQAEIAKDKDFAEKFEVIWKKCTDQLWSN
jgi:hypothetical protein